MRLKAAKIRNFKRFTDLTIQNIPATTRLIMSRAAQNWATRAFSDQFGLYPEFVK